MSMSRLCVFTLSACLCIACQPATIRDLAPDESKAIADTVGALFVQIPDATNDLDLDRILGFHRQSDALTYVARGQVTRTYAAFENVVRTQFRGIAEADLQWKDTYVDVLTRDVATAIATYEFNVVTESGASFRSAGTYMVIFVMRDGQWKIEFSSHTFPG